MLYNIAIDGPSGAGKSTIAKKVSKELNSIYVDTGSMYRAVALYVMQNNINYEDEESIINCMKNIDIQLKYIDNSQNVYLNGENVTTEVRKEEVGKVTSKYISTIKKVRKELVKMQQDMASKNSVVMDGRDIGSVVLPFAFLKIYLDASVEARGTRRYEELLAKGFSVSYEEIVEEIKKRDYDDKNRKESPLVKCDDAIYLDTSNLSIEEVTNKILDLYNEKKQATNITDVMIAKSAGFCYGVRKAVDTVFNELDKNNVTTLGPIIHNKIVTNEMNEKGAEIINTVNEYKNGKLIIRSHGVSKKIIDEIESKNINYIDCTCRDVKKIHDIVQEQSEKGYNIIILGNETHPEIEGIMGWAKTPVTVIKNENDEKIKTLSQGVKYYLVAQTTYNTCSFNKTIEVIKSNNIDVVCENTICPATEIRQKEAIAISKNVDYMLIIGDKQSSNTNKLYELCKNNCINTYFIENISDLQLKYKLFSGRIGITAGASTPKAIIKEAILFMCENNEQSFEELLRQSEETTLRRGTTVTGTVIKVVGEEVFVNVKYKSDGIIPYGEFSKNPEIKPANEVKPGDEIDVFVLTLNDGEGNVKLSRKRVEDQKALFEFEELHNTQEIVKGKVVRVVKGGLIASIRGMEIFVPASQISSSFVRDLNQFVDQEFDFQIIEFNKSKGKVVAGRKEIAAKEEASKKAEIFGKIKEGTKIEGIVRRVVDYGAFVDIGGIDGLVHISELAWSRVNKVTDVVNVNDTVEVVVLEVNEEKSKIALSLKAVKENPWSVVETKYPVGAEVTGKVVRIVEFGAFVEIEPGIDALLHISQISNEHTEKVEDALTIGQEIKAEVIELDLNSKKISISSKKVNKSSETTEA